MKILITNDDGIDAPGLEALDEIAREIAGPDGEVWTVAPISEQSGVGHCVSYSFPMMIEQRGPRRYVLHGTPADCVLAALFRVMEDHPPDLVLSGVNRGNNSGENTLYSGTVGAAMEAALHSFRSIALSQYCGPGNRGEDDIFEAARVHAAPLVRKLLELDIWPVRDGYRTFYNVNFPPVRADGVLGAQVVAQGVRKDSAGFRVVPYRSPSHRDYLFVAGGSQYAPAEPGTDVHANMAGYISVTPMRADLTASDAINSLEGAFHA